MFYFEVLSPLLIPFEGSWVQGMLAQQLIKIGAIPPGQRGSLRDIPTRGREYPDKISPFGPLLHLFQRSQLMAGFARCLSAQQEKVRGNQVMRGQHYSTLNNVG